MASEHYCARCHHSYKVHAGGGCSTCRSLPFGSCSTFTERLCCDGLYGDPHAIGCPEDRDSLLTGEVTEVISLSEGVICWYIGDHVVYPEFRTPIYEAARLESPRQ